MSSRQRLVLVALGAALISAAVFAASIHGPWIYDDHLLIPENPYVHSMSWWPRWFVTGFWDISDEFVKLAARPLITYWRPTITATYAIDWQAGGGTSTIFHVTNLLWHAGVGALAFLVMRRWTGTLWAGFLAALVFAVHPTKSECVAWIAGRTDVVCMFGMLVATQGIARRLRSQRGGLLLEVFGTLLAYTCKEQSIVLPAFAAIEGWIVAGRPAIERKSLSQMIRVGVPQLVVAGSYLLIRYLFLPMNGPKPRGPNSAPLDHVQAVFESAGRYLMLTFAPHDLSIQHGLVRVTKGESLHSMPYMVIGGVGMAALVAGAIYLRKRMPAVTLGIAFFLATLSPTLNIIDMQMETLVSERFLYVPLFGLAFAIGALVVQFRKRWFCVLVAAAIALMALLSVLRSLDYSNEVVFWERELALHPGSAEAHRARMRFEIGRKHYYAALADTLELAKQATQKQDVPAAVDASQLLSDLTPDLDRQTLETIDAFAADLQAHKAPSATLSAKGLTIVVPTTTTYFEVLWKAAEVRLLRLRSRLRSRLGDDAGATKLADDAFKICPKCASALVGTVFAYAAASQYDAARTLMDQGQAFVPATVLDPIRGMVEHAAGEYARSLIAQGPAQLQARAAAYAALELWGRAYEILAPYKQQIMGAPKMVMGFAELAFRAGDTATAREVLTSVGVDDIEGQLTTWAASMGWQ